MATEARVRVGLAPARLQAVQPHPSGAGVRSGGIGVNDQPRAGNFLVQPEGGGKRELDEGAASNARLKWSKWSGLSAPEIARHAGAVRRGELEDRVVLGCFD